ncbi:MAG: hypothetical protein RIR88_787 [Actinomycetota bacterium]
MGGIMGIHTKQKLIKIGLAAVAVAALVAVPASGQAGELNFQAARAETPGAEIFYTAPGAPRDIQELLDSTLEFNPAIIALCNLRFGDVVITSYLAASIGSVSLLCGDAYSGYVHIRSNHGSEWQQIVDQSGGGANWDDLMDFAAKSALWVPSEGYPKGVGDGKLCYTAPIQIKNQQRQVIRNMSPTIIASLNNRKVITAIPTTNPSC